MRCRNLAQRRNRSLVLWNDRFADTKRDTGVRTGIARSPAVANGRKLDLFGLTLNLAKEYNP